MSIDQNAGGEPARILHAVTRMDRGGIETFLMRVYRHIDRDRVQLDFLVHKPNPGAYDEEIRALGGRIYPISFSYNPLSLPRYIRELKAFFTAHPEYRVAHAHLNAFNGIYLSAAAGANVPVRIAHIHAQSSGSALREPLWNLVKRVGSRAFTERYACSEQAGLWAYGRQAPFSVIENGIPLSLFAFDDDTRARVREQHGLQGRMVIGHVGAFRPDKNQIFLVDVLAEVRKRNQSAALLLVGAGSEQSKVSDRAAALGLTSHVVFAGETSATEKYYSAMDVFAFPSIDEGLGIVAIEAQASGLPSILSTGVPAEAAATDLVIRLPLNGNTSAAQWADAILSQSVQPQDRGLAHPGLVQFDIARTARQLQDVYLGSSSERMQS